MLIIIVLIHTHTTYRTLLHFSCIARPLHQRQETDEQLPSPAGELNDFDFPKVGTAVFCYGF